MPMGEPLCLAPRPSPLVLYAAIYLDCVAVNYRYATYSSVCIDSPRVAQKLESTQLVNFGCICAAAFLVLWGMMERARDREDKGG